jgi:two-component system sensor histidine kinase UhpB
MLVKNTQATNSLYKTGSKGIYPATPVAETLINGFFTVDHKWTVKYWNKAAEKILRVQAKDIVGENLWKKFAEVIPIELYAIDQGAFQKDVPVHFREYWGEMGAWFDVITYHCDNTLSVSFKSSNHPNTEYTDDPVQRLKVLTELYRFGTEITNDCLWEWNLQTKEIFWIDGGHKRVFGYQVENALIPQSFWEQCIHPADKERVLTGLKKIISKGSSSIWEEEYRFKSADGGYLFVHDRARIMYDEHNKAFRMIGATQDITEKVLLEKKLAQERLTKQREITDAVLTAQEKEREIIGTELNENLNQLLVVIKWNVQMAKTDKDKRDICLENSAEYLDHVINEIRKMYKTLVIPNINITGLFDNLNNLRQDLNKVHSIKFDFYNEGIDEEEDLGKDLQIDIFRIVQEQLNNIIKHSHATHATIHLSRKANEIILAVADNGKGCNLSKEKKGVGIINITSRTELYGGRVLIASKPGKGYELKVVIPCFTADD